MNKKTNELEYLNFCYKCKKPSCKSLCDKCIKAYDKTWYYKISRQPCPENWMSARPIKIFGIFLFFLIKVAKDNYEWECNETYGNIKECRCKKHKTK